MKLRPILAGTALAALALVGAPQLGLSDVTTRAEAAVNVNIGIFYDQLGDYGDWVNYRDQYVFIPTGVSGNWRPYTRGHWVYTERYGWTWASAEPFGWATYHYGRWGYGDDIGWYWVPGRQWAPAWVSWRRSNNYVVWAPLPPSRHGGLDVGIDITVGDIPDYYWVAVPTRRFLAPQLNVVIINDDYENRQVIRDTRYMGTPRITNNVVVNNVIDVNAISQATGQKVRTVEVRTTDNPVKAKATADQVTAFQGEIATDAKVKPQKLSDVTKVKKVKRNAGTDATAPDATGNATAPVDNTGTAPADQPSSGQAATPVTGKNKKKVNTGEANAPAATGEQPATQAQDQQPVKKRKKQNDNAAAPAQSGEQPVQAQDQTTGKKKKKLQQGTEDATGSTTAAPAQPGKGKKARGNAPDQNANAPEQNANPPADQKNRGKGKKGQACDPATDATCVPAQ